MSSNQRFVLILAGMLLVGLALMKVSPAQQGPKVEPVVTTKRLVIVGADGKTPRAIIGETYEQRKADGGKTFFTGITLYDRKGVERAALELSDEANMSYPRLVLRDKNGNERAQLYLLSAVEGSVLQFADEKGNERALVGVNEKYSEFTLRHQTDKFGLLHGSDKKADVVNNRPEPKDANVGDLRRHLMAFPAENAYTPAAQILVTDGTTRMLMGDAVGKERVKIVTGKDGTAQVLTSDEKGDMRALKR